jgi:hypothetical protein
MSWISKNYEKAALGGTVLVALGLAYLGWAKLGGVDGNFGGGLPEGGGTKTAVDGAELIPKTLQSLKLERTWNPATVGDRMVDLFTGTALFIKNDEPEKTIDLDMDAPVHDPIPNTWWLENRLDPGFADSPSRDPDSDGFSNMEEYLAKTDPNNGKAYPALIAKLMYLRDETITWYIRPGYDDGKGNFSFSYVDSKNNNLKTPIEAPIKPEDLFFDKAPVKNRFKLLGSEVVTELNERTNFESEVTIVRIEDLRPNKKGTIYKIPAPLTEARRNEHLKYDRSAVFSLEALGLNGTEFTVEENTPFALPPGAPTKDYLLKEVTPNSVVVEYPDADGSRKTVDIGKGSLPRLSE